MSDNIKDYSFELPDELIAQDPAPTRESARLLVVRRNPTAGMPRFEDLLVSDLPELIKKEKSLQNSLWLRNRSKVLPARFYAYRPSGSKHEIVVHTPREPGIWNAIVRNQAVFKYPQKLFFDLNNQKLSFESPQPGIVDFRNLPRPIEDILNDIGEMPVPPYIKKRSQERDRERYQTVWARDDKQLSVAAPTASLHFTHELCQKMQNNGVSFADLILHVGLGTFEPLRQNSISQHELHSEAIEVSANDKNTNE